MMRSMGGVIVVVTEKRRSNEGAIPKAKRCSSVGCEITLMKTRHSPGPAKTKTEAEEVSGLEIISIFGLTMTEGEPSESDLVFTFRVWSLMGRKEARLRG
jgi:hypothetical protein